MRTLVLNSDFFPINVWSWKRAMVKLLCSKTIMPISYFKAVIKDGSGREYPVPAVVVLKRYINCNKQAPYSKTNVYVRDMFQCQYCGLQLERQERTIDHVIPRSHWKNYQYTFKVTSFENVVTCCKKCNLYKGNKSLQQCGLTLLNKPKKVTIAQICQNKIALGYVPNEWEQYLSEQKKKPHGERAIYNQGH